MRKYYQHREGKFPAPPVPGEPNYVVFEEDGEIFSLDDDGTIEHLYLPFITLSEMVEEGIWVEVKLFH